MLKPQLNHSRPSPSICLAFGYVAHLIDCTAAREQWLAPAHLAQYAAQAPHVDAFGVLLVGNQNLRRPIPSRCNVVGEAGLGIGGARISIECLIHWRYGTGQSKVGQFAPVRSNGVGVLRRESLAIAREEVQTRREREKAVSRSNSIATNQTPAIQLSSGCMRARRARSSYLHLLSTSTLLGLRSR